MGSSHSSSACLPALCLTSPPTAPSPLQGLASTKSPSLNTTQQTRTQFAGNHTFPAVSLGLFSLFSISPQVTLLLSLCHSESFLPSHAMSFLIYSPFSPNCFPLPMLNIFTFLQDQMNTSSTYVMRLHVDICPQTCLINKTIVTELSFASYRNPNYTGPEWNDVCS